MDRKEIADAFYSKRYDTFDCKNAVDTVLNHPGVRDYRVTYDMYTNEKIVKAFSMTEDDRCNRKGNDEMNRKENNDMNRVDEYCKTDVIATFEAAYNINKKSLDIKKVIYNDPATIIFWNDGTKTIVKCCEDDEYDPYVGVSMAINKKLLGDDYKRIFKRAMSFYEEPEDEKGDFYEPALEKTGTASIGLVPLYADESVSVKELKKKLDSLKRAFSALDL